MSGLTRGATAAHLARATLEAMALQNVDILRAMERDLGRRLSDLRVDGGASANNILMQLQADYLGKAIVRPKVIETTVAGACFLAGLGVGIWKDTDALAKVWRADQSFLADDHQRPSQKVVILAAGGRPRQILSVNSPWPMFSLFHDPTRKSPIKPCAATAIINGGL